MTPPEIAGQATEEFDNDAPWPPPPSPDAQAAAVYTPRRGSISEGASIGEADAGETPDIGETPPPMYDGATIRYLNQGDSGFDEIRADIDLISEGGTPEDGPDDDPPENDPPPLALRFPVPEDEDEGEDDELDTLRPTG